MRRILTAVGVIGAAVATAPRVLKGTIVGRWLGITGPEGSPENGNPSASGNRTANLYVILLCDEVWRSRKFREDNPNYRAEMPCVYVGVTSLDPEERFKQHKSGYKASRTARKYGIHLVPGLYEHMNPVPAREREEREKRLAFDLRRKGYGVWSN